MPFVMDWPFAVMNKAKHSKALSHQAAAAIKLLLLAALLGGWVLPSQAKQASAPFTVSINLQTNSGALPNTGICRSTSMVGAFGTTVTVYCATGAIASFSGDPSTLPWTTKQDSSYRYVTQVSRGSELLGTLDIYTGGTVTTWRMINLAHRDYLEMMVHW
jgi:hypothetical protein